MYREFVEGSTWLGGRACRRVLFGEEDQAVCPAPLARPQAPGQAWDFRPMMRIEGLGSRSPIKVSLASCNFHCFELILAPDVR